MSISLHLTQLASIYGSQLRHTRTLQTNVYTVISIPNSCKRDMLRKPNQFPLLQKGETYMLFYLALTAPISKVTVT